jgi:hypothetical protein
MFWELTSRSSPLKFETRDPHIVTLEILSGVREELVPNTNAIFVRLYQSKYKVIKLIAGNDSSSILNLIRSNRILEIRTG